jgi:hypothetical protein
MVITGCDDRRMTFLCESECSNQNPLILIRHAIGGSTVLSRSYSGLA